MTDLGRQSRHKADTVPGRWGLGQIADASPGLAALAACPDLGRQSSHKADTVPGRWGLGQIADASPGLAAVVQGDRIEPACQAAEREPDDEIIVTAPVISVPGPAQGEMPSPEFIVQIYNAEHRGAELYERKRYRQALPYLLAAAKRGFKWSQASLADIYLYGRGGVPKDLEAGIGWLGVAAEPVATKEGAIPSVLEQFPSLHLSQVFETARSGPSTVRGRPRPQFVAPLPWHPSRHSPCLASPAAVLRAEDRRHYQRLPKLVRCRRASREVRVGCQR